MMSLDSIVLNPNTAPANDDMSWSSGRHPGNLESHVGLSTGTNGRLILAYETQRAGRQIDYAEGPIDIDQAIELRDRLDEAIQRFALQSIATSIYEEITRDA